jgi:hypothetical protein
MFLLVNYYITNCVSESVEKLHFSYNSCQQNRTALRLFATLIANGER